MAANLVRITAPSRIHFGLLSMGGDEERRFGGAGVVVQQPALILEMGSAAQSTITGPLAPRVQTFLDFWCQHTGIAAHVACHVVAAPPQHVGLGVGTQLGMSVAVGLDTLFGRTNVDLEERAKSVQRGLRSAVGAYGFRDGGLIVESGKKSNESIGMLGKRVDLPESWHLLLVRPHGVVGLAGDDEKKAFDDLPPIADELKTRLRAELFDRLLPAAREGDFVEFSESVFRYGIAAGECFASSQGGPFLSLEIADLVNYCREHGVSGVGQSSWGPTVFCWFPNQDLAIRFTKENFRSQMNCAMETIVTPVCRYGANIEVEKLERKSHGTLGSEH